MGIEIATSAEIEEIKDIVLNLNSQVLHLTKALEAQRQEQLPDWLTVKEAADYLRISPDTIRRKVKAGHFETRRDGKNILIARDTIVTQASR